MQFMNLIASPRAPDATGDATTKPIPGVDSSQSQFDSDFEAELDELSRLMLAAMPVDEATVLQVPESIDAAQEMAVEQTVDGLVADAIPEPHADASLMMPGKPTENLDVLPDTQIPSGQTVPPNSDSAAAAVAPEQMVSPNELSVVPAVIDQPAHLQESQESQESVDALKPIAHEDSSHTDDGDADLPELPKFETTGKIQLDAKDATARASDVEVFATPEFQKNAAIQNAANPKSSQAVIVHDAVDHSNHRSAQTLDWEPDVESAVLEDALTGESAEGDSEIAERLEMNQTVKQSATTFVPSAVVQRVAAPEISGESVQLVSSEVNDRADVMDRADLVTQQTVRADFSPTESFEVVASRNVSVADQLADAVTTSRLQTSSEQTRVEIELKPPELGKVSIEFVSRPEGLSVRIVTSIDATAQIVQDQLAQLQDSLKQAGVSVDDVSVDQHSGDSNPFEIGRAHV